MKTLYLHVGMHKAGSTSIQYALNKDRESLIDQGVYFPLTATEGNTRAHQNIAWELNKDDRFVPETGSLDDLFQELSSVKPEKVILSSEGFTSMDSRPGPSRMRRIEHLSDPQSTKRTRYHRLREFANALGYSIVTVGFVREYVACLNSAYTQQVKTFKHGRSFDAHVEEQRDNDRWCYETVFVGWEAISKEVICLANGDDNVKTLYEVLGVRRPEGQQEAPRLNMGVGPKTIECSRILFKALEAQEHERVGQMRHRNNKKKGKDTPHRLVKKTGKDLGWNEELFWGFDLKTAQQVHAGFVERDRRFLDRHGIRFTPAFDKKRQNDFRLEQLPAGAEREEFLTALNGICERLDIDIKSVV